MQKRNNLLKIIKCSAVIAAFTALTFASLLLSPLAARTASRPRGGTEPLAQNSLYARMPAKIVASEKEDVSVPKMNNENIKNANSIKNYRELTTLSVKNAETGEIVSMDIEAYVLNVLLAEMPQSFAMQALMAQAVAIRSFAVRCAVTDTDKHPDCDVCTDYRHCQSYVDARETAYDISRAAEAVESTKGIIAVYESEPILAAYHASSVDFTKDSREVWGGSVDYLRPVAAPEGREASAKSLTVPLENARHTFSSLGFADIPAFIDDGTGLVLYAQRENTKVSAKEIARAFGLRSDRFSIAFDSGNVTLTSYGYGHGVGMSQVGANVLAENGMDFYDILKYYYTGIGFDFLARPIS